MSWLGGAHGGDVLVVEPRSVVAGRQRWRVGVLVGRPGVAEGVEARLRQVPHVTEVHANTLTGGLLVFHDAGLTSDEVGRLVRRVVATPDRPVVDEPVIAVMSVLPGGVPDGSAARGFGRSVVVGGVVAAAGVGVLVVVSPMTRLWVLVAASVVVVRRAWRRSAAQREASTLPGSSRHPVAEIVGGHRAQFCWASTLSAAGQVLELVPAAFLGLMASLLLGGNNALLAGLGVLSASGQLLFLAATAAAAFALSSAVSHAADVRWSDLAQQVAHEWRRDVYAHVQNVELRYLEGDKTSRVAQVVNDDIDQLGRFLASAPGYFVKLGTAVVMVGGAFLVVAPGLAWIAVAPIPVVAWMSFSHRERAAPDQAASSAARSVLNSQVLNNLEAGATVRSFAAERYEIDRIEHLSGENRDASRRVRRRSSAYTQTVRACAGATFTGMLLFGGGEVLAATLSFEAFFFLIGLPNMVLWQVQGFGDAVDSYQQAVSALDRVNELRRLPVEPPDTGRPLDGAQVTGEMAIEDVTFAYPGRPPVLNGLSLRFAAGATTGIVGVTGAGKTTIAKLLLRFLEPGSGRVFIDGEDLAELRAHDLRQVIAFVAHDAFLFDGTVEDNINYGTFDAGHARVEAAAALAEADSFVQALPSGYDTRIGERGVTLSGGQRQRISLARALLKDAPVLILDEATSAVDNETEAAIRHALKGFGAGRTLVIIAHRLSNIRNADWIYVLGESGTVAEQGTHEQLLANRGVYEALWRLQIGEEQ